MNTTYRKHIFTVLFFFLIFFFGIEFTKEIKGNNGIQIDNHRHQRDRQHQLQTQSRSFVFRNHSSSKQKKSYLSTVVGD